MSIMLQQIYYKIKNGPRVLNWIYLDLSYLEIIKFLVKSWQN